MAWQLLRTLNKRILGSRSTGILAASEPDGRLPIASDVKCQTELENEQKTIKCDI